MLAVFRAWRHACCRREEVQAQLALPRIEHCFNPLMQQQFARSLHRVWILLREMCTNRISVILSQTWIVAALVMPFPAIKTASHVGAVVLWYRERGGPARPRWHWFDPGNWIYATVWHLLRKSARHHSQHGSPARARQAERLLLAMRRCESRWPRLFHTARSMELLGDLVELALGRGYCCAEFEPVILCFSELVCIIKEIWSVVCNQLPIEVDMMSMLSTNPYVLADILLLACSAHSTGDLQSFQEVCSHVAIHFAV